MIQRLFVSDHAAGVQTLTWLQEDEDEEEEEL